jgi:hypothetical protein
MSTRPANQTFWWAREGAIPAAKLGNGGGFCFKREDLDQILEGRRQAED